LVGFFVSKSWEKKELRSAAAAMAFFGVTHTPSILFFLFAIKCHESIEADLTTISLKFFYENIFKI